MGRTRGSLLTIAARALLLAALGVGTVGCGDSHSACTAPIPSVHCIRLVGGAPDGGHNGCTDVGAGIVCEAGEWTCPAGSIPLQQCDCEGGGAPGAPRSCTSASFQVHGQLAVPGAATGNGAPAPPTSQDFLLHVDPVAASVVSFTEMTVDRAMTTTDGSSFDVASGFRVGLPGACGSDVTYSTFRFSVDGPTGTLAGTGTGTANVGVGDELFSYPVTLTFTGTLDQAGPAFDLTAASDPFHPTDLRASRPLPSSATAHLVAGGESITLVPLQTTLGLVLGFAFPAAPLPRYGTVYDVKVTPWQDLAGNAGATPGRLTTRAAPLLVAGEDFEDPSAVSGDGLIVDATALPPISGQRSAILLDDQFASDPALQSPHIAARLKVAPGDTVVRFAVRPFSHATSPSTQGITMQAGVPGGAITTAVLPAQETLTTSAPSSSGSLGLGDVRTVELPLPAGVTSEVIVDLHARTWSSCGGLPQVRAGYLVDDLRVE